MLQLIQQQIRNVFENFAYIRTKPIKHLKPRIRGSFLPTVTFSSNPSYSIKFFIFLANDNFYVIGFKPINSILK